MKLDAFLCVFFREAKRAISNFLCLGCNTVIITLGREGAIFASLSDPKPIHVRAPRVEEVLDTTVMNANIFEKFLFFSCVKLFYLNENPFHTHCRELVTHLLVHLHIIWHAIQIFRFIVKLVVPLQ